MPVYESDMIRFEFLTEVETDDGKMVYTDIQGRKLIVNGDIEEIRIGCNIYHFEDSELQFVHRHDGDKVYDAELNCETFRYNESFGSWRRSYISEDCDCYIVSECTGSPDHHDCKAALVGDGTHDEVEGFNNIDYHVSALTDNAIDESEYDGEDADWLKKCGMIWAGLKGPDHGLVQDAEGKWSLA